MLMVNISSRALASHQKNTFWWGSPSHFFRTNAALKQNLAYHHEILHNPNTGLTITGSKAWVLRGLFLEELLYMQNKMANDVDYVKKLFIRKIELNVTYALVYRVIEWRD